VVPGLIVRSLMLRTVIERHIVFDDGILWLGFCGEVSEDFRFCFCVEIDLFVTKLYLKMMSWPGYFTVVDGTS
jgi:hypothetical protein